MSKISISKLPVGLVEATLVWVVAMLIMGLVLPAIAWLPTRSGESYSIEFLGPKDEQNGGWVFGYATFLDPTWIDEVWGAKTEDVPHSVWTSLGSCYIGYSFETGLYIEYNNHLIQIFLVDGMWGYQSWIGDPMQTILVHISILLALFIMIYYAISSWEIRQLRIQG